VVAKTARVVEDVVIGKESTTREEAIKDTVRRTDVEVDQIGEGSRAQQQPGRPLWRPGKAQVYRGLPGHGASRRRNRLKGMYSPVLTTIWKGKLWHR